MRYLIEREQFERLSFCPSFVVIIRADGSARSIRQPIHSRINWQFIDQSCFREGDVDDAVSLISGFPDPYFRPTVHGFVGIVIPCACGKAGNAPFPKTHPPGFPCACKRSGASYRLVVRDVGHLHKVGLHFFSAGPSGVCVHFVADIVMTLSTLSLMESGIDDIFSLSPPFSTEQFGFQKEIYFFFWQSS